MNRLCRLSVVAIAVPTVLFWGMSSRAFGDLPPLPTPSTQLTMEMLLHSDQATLESLYRGAGPGSIPFGSYAGKAITSPGTRKGIRQSKLIGQLWKGKEFRGDGMMINRLAFGVSAVRADMFYGDSWLDGRPSIILDYANTSRLFGKARDEMREIAPGLYLGLTYIRKCPGPKLEMFYTVQALPGCSSERVGIRR
jgi:hypothetical protein